MKQKATNKLTLVSLTLMIFTTVFGFANASRGFLLMGYAAIPWYLVGAVTYFIPFAFMIAEFGSAYKDKKGGIYSWMEDSVGPRFAFIGIFMWYTSYIVWMVNTATNIWVPFSNAVFGSDRTSEWSLLNLTSPQTIGVLGTLWLVLVFILISRGLKSVKKVTSIGGTAVLLLNGVLFIGGFIILAINRGELAQPFGNFYEALTTSPNPNYNNLIGMMSFLTFAIFAFGGTEIIGGLVDQTENPLKTFPKGLLLATAVISLGYTVGILTIGFFTNWDQVLSDPLVNTGNVTYTVMQNLGYEFGYALGVSELVALQIGRYLARFVGLSMFLAISGAFMTLSYGPLKQLIDGTPKWIWPKYMATFKNGLPINAMRIQAILAITLIIVVSFGGDSVSDFFDKIILMTNVAMTLPYVFLSIAFIFFKRRDDIKKPFVIYKNKGIGITFACIVTAVVAFANLFTIIEPAINGNMANTLWMMAGPVFFGMIAIILYQMGVKKHK